MKRTKAIIYAGLVLAAGLVAAQTYEAAVHFEPGGDQLTVASGGEVEVESGGAIDVESGGSFKLAGTAVSSTAAELNILDGVTATAAELNKTDGIAATAYNTVTEGVSFTEDGSTTYTGTVEIPAGAILQNIQIVTTVLWDDATSATLKVGDDDDDDGWFTGVNVKVTDLLVGEVLDITNAENWGGANGAYLVAATGRKGRTTAGVDSGVYFGAASEVIGVITTGGQDGSAGRSFMFVTYAVPTVVAATGA